MKSESILPVSFPSVKLEDDFWRPRLDIHSRTTLTKDLELCEKTGRIDNFRKAAGSMKGDFVGIYYNDSDVYKVLEGIGYSLRTVPDPGLEKRADEVIDAVAAAQWPDGYLHTYFSLPPHRDDRWTDMEKHEDYCGGHLIEAGIAYYQGTGKDKLLTVARRFADCLYETFYKPGRPWVPGHEEIELALLRLHRLTGDGRYAELAQYLLDQRGHGLGRGAIWEKPEWGPRYCQDDRPAEDLREVSGHAVRAMFLYTAMADMETQTPSGRYREALDSLWDSVVHRNMYVTGGIGSSATDEGFTGDYDLPNAEAYCETCASFGMVLWSHRMNLLKADARYADVMERAMYNGLPAGVSLEGDRYFYVNPLSSAGDHHRQEWYDCSCCPTQIARFMPSVGGYVYAVSQNGASVYVNLFVRSVSDLSLPGGNHIRLRQETGYPWDGKVRLTVERAEFPVTLNFRLPGWCGSFSLRRNGKPCPVSPARGYIAAEHVGPGETVEYEMDMPARRVHADRRVKADTGRVCLARGPVVYCVEQVDQMEGTEPVLGRDDRLAWHYEAGLLGGVTVVDAFSRDGRRLRAVPYYAWDNREAGKMDVWLKEAEEESSGLYR